MNVELDEVKIKAKKLKAYFLSKNIEVKLGYCYEALSILNGFPNWDTYCAWLKKGEKNCE